MGNIYDGCESNDNFISAFTRKEMNQLLDKTQKEILSQGKNVAFVDISNGMLYEARVTVYAGEISKDMQEYKHKFVKINKKWCRECLLGFCAVCGKKRECVMSSPKGMVCDKCSNKLFAENDLW